MSKKKSKWCKFKPYIAGFYFSEPLLGESEPVGVMIRIRKQWYWLFRTTTKSSVYWRRDDPVWPVYFAVGDDGIYYDSKSVGRFWKHVLEKHPWPAPMHLDSIEGITD